MVLMRRRRHIATASSAALSRAAGLLLIGGCASSPERFEFREVHMGCDARIVLHAPSRSDAVHAARAAFDRMEELDAVLSDWRIDSEIERLGDELDRSPTPLVITMSPLLTKSLHCAMCVHRATGGRFDPTLGALTRLWRRHRSNGTAPSAAEIEAARLVSGAEHIAIDGSELTLRTPGLRFDFGGIGKGMAADAALEALREQGLHSAFVQLAGDGAAGSPPPGLHAWRVRVAATGEMVELGDHGGISSSGDQEQHLELDGDRISHILDPTTGLGARNSPGVTVIILGRGPCTECVTCGGAALADGLATAATLLSASALRSLLDDFPEARVIVTPPGDRGASIVTPSRAAPESAPDPALAK